MAIIIETTSPVPTLKSKNDKDRKNNLCQDHTITPKDIYGKIYMIILATTLYYSI